MRPFFVKSKFAPSGHKIVSATETTYPRVPGVLFYTIPEADPQRGRAARRT